VRIERERERERERDGYVCVAKIPELEAEIVHGAGVGREGTEEAAGEM
jgi:hypothetical protein